MTSEVLATGQTGSTVDTLRNIETFIGTSAGDSFRVNGGSGYNLDGGAEGDLLDLSGYALGASYSLPVIMMNKEAVNRAFESSLTEGRLGLEIVAYRSGAVWLPYVPAALIIVLTLIATITLIQLRRHARHRADTEEQLRAAYAFRQAMSNSVITGLRAIDLDGRITYVNAAFCRMTGFSENAGNFLLAQGGEFGWGGNIGQRQLLGDFGHSGLLSARSICDATGENLLDVVDGGNPLTKYGVFASF